MILRFRLPPVVLACIAVPALAQQSPRDFQLPPEPTPTATPDVQGPVDTEGAVPIRPRAIPTPTPSPSRQTPIVLPEATTVPSANRPIVLPGSVPANRQAPAAPPIARPSATPTAFADDSVAAEADIAIDPAMPLAGSTPDLPVPDAVSELATGPENPESGLWWIGALAALGLGALGGGYILRRKRAAAIVPPIERPRVERAGEPVGAMTANALSLRIEALRMSRSLLNATLAYRVTVLNRSVSALNEVAIEADLASAHGELPMEQQVAGAGTALEERHATKRLAAGQSARFEGQVTLPLASARVIHQGQVALLVPLLRLRARAAGIEPVARTLAIGPAASGGGSRLVPFNLEDGPRSYEPLAQKTID
ncbi:hypothetical protein [Qipengyuania sp. MTN3-11]|uniref:hypothetical protein n=1 Tax=Qipengyuania sp. MTN3-11 TaxID=3056557 RepID=UPI0036F22FE7